MSTSDVFGAHPELFGPFYALAFLVAYVTAFVVGYRRGWPPAAWLLVLAAAGVGAVVGTRLLPLGLDGLRTLLAEGALPDAPVRRFPGTVLGSLVAAEAARRLLGVRQSLLDPLAYSGAVGLAVARLGCLAAGCCFGTPTALPWGVTYASGSTVHGFHLAHGVAATGAAVPVHPVPLYDVVFAVVLLVALPRLSRALRAPGSLCGATVGAYAAYRFLQEFVRADGVDAVGGLTPMQGGMVVAVALAAFCVAVAERRARTRPAEPLCDREPPLRRLLVVFVGLVAARLALGEWLTATEAAVVLVRLVPAAAVVGAVALRSAAAPQVRWAVGALAAALPIVVGFQPTAPAEEPFRAWAVEGHAGFGRYEELEICTPELYDYRTGGVGVAHVWADPANGTTREAGVRVYAGDQELATARVPTDSYGGGDPEGTLVVHPYYQHEGPRAGIHVGLQAGQLPLWGPEGDGPALPALGVRLGPRALHFQGGFLDSPHAGVPAPAYHVGLGTGRLTARGQEVRWRGGVSPSGFYVSGGVAADGLLIEPWAAFGPAGDRSVHHLGLRLRYQFPAR